MNKPQETPAETAQRARQLITNLIPLSTAGGRTVSRQDEFKIESLFEIFQMFAAENEQPDRAALVEELQRHLFSMSNSHLSSYDNWKKKIQGKPTGAAEVTDAAS